MATDVHVNCSKKRGDQYDPHERIQGLGGVHGGQRWYMEESAIIAELEKPEETRHWRFYTSVSHCFAWVVVASHDGRKYLKTQADSYSPDNLLTLPNCP